MAEKIKTMQADRMPIGSIYLSIDATNPAVYFGGTWQSIGSGRVLQGADETHAAGETIEAGLPNITGGFAPWAEQSDAYDTRKPEGAFRSETSNQPGWGTSNGVDKDNKYMTFDASRCSPVYGKSSTVQPPAFVVNIWVRIA